MGFETGFHWFKNARFKNAHDQKHQKKNWGQTKFYSALTITLYFQQITEMQFEVYKRGGGIRGKNFGNYPGLGPTSKILKKIPEFGQNSQISQKCSYHNTP